MDFPPIKILVSKDTNEKGEREWKKILANHLGAKSPVSRIHRELL